MKFLVLLLVASAAFANTEQQDIARRCAEGGGCVYATKAQIMELVDQIRKQARDEAKALCGARTGIVM